MKKIDTARALRDPEYRASLSAAELAALPAHPAGLSMVSDDALQTVTGGCGFTFCTTCPPRQTTFVESCVPPGSHCP
ncbi:MAG: mersacidin/lichenicidin family type 2 lantibiotic [Acidobacteriota bacterium]